MPELTWHHIEQIRRDISSQEISYSYLLDELVDHVCCEVEDEMISGLSFHEAYDRVRMKIGPGRFSKIQKETLYAVDTNYRNMKKLMKLSGIAGSTLFGLAALFKIQHWQGAGIMLTLGAIVLAFIFLPAAVGVLWKETHNKGKLFLLASTFLSAFLFITATLFKIQHWQGAGYLFFFTFVSFLLMLVPALLIFVIKNAGKRFLLPVYAIGLAGLASYLAGMLFKIQHWPHAGTLMLAGIIISCFIALPLYTWMLWKDEAHITPRFLFIIVSSLLIIVPGTLINLDMQNTYEGEYHYSQEQQRALNSYLKSENESVIASSKDMPVYPGMEALHLKTRALLSLIDNIQAEMVRESEGKPGSPAGDPVQLRQTTEGLEINYKMLSNPFVSSPVNNFLERGREPRIELEKSLREFVQYLTGINQGTKPADFSQILDTDLFIPSAQNSSMMTGLHSLELLQNTILTVEARMLINMSAYYKSNSDINK